MKKFVLKSSVIAVAALFSSAAFAIVDINGDTGQVTYASELTYSATNPLVGDGAGQLAAATQLGFGVSTGQTRFVKVTLNNATFAGSAGGMAVTDGTTTSVGTVVQGGTTGTNSVVYQFTAATNYTQGAAVIIGDPTGGLAVANNGSPVTISYQLFETATQAVAGTPSLASAGPTALAKFGPGLNYTVTRGTATADVASGFKQFCANATCTPPDTVVGDLGNIVYGVNAVNNRNGAAITLADLTTAATAIHLSGDFSAVGGVTAGTAGCAGPAAPGAFTVATNKQSASVTVGTSAATFDVCYVVNGTTVLSAQTVQQSLDVTPANADVNISDTAAAPLGDVVRNGASTVALNVTDPANPDQTFIRITNMGTLDGKVTGTLIGQ
ncbi:MAG TPA: hypothetical protein VFP44_17425, partial [Usitatibacter sp.]|nr:hypothetical protein [Usitatibacter sp.]